MPSDCRKTPSNVGSLVPYSPTRAGSTFGCAAEAPVAARGTDEDCERQPSQDGGRAERAARPAVGAVARGCCDTGVPFGGAVQGLAPEPPARDSAPASPTTRRSDGDEGADSGLGDPGSAP